MARSCFYFPQYTYIYTHIDILGGIPRPVFAARRQFFAVSFSVWQLQSNWVSSAAEREFSISSVGACLLFALALAFIWFVWDVCIFQLWFIAVVVPESARTLLPISIPVVCSGSLGTFPNGRCHFVAATSFAPFPANAGQLAAFRCNYR